MARYLPSVIWPTRRIGTKGPYQIVSTASLAKLTLSFMPGNGKDGVSIQILRKDARMLARRINQCLDETK